MSDFDAVRAAARDAVRRAIAEDLGAGDVTSEGLVPDDALAEAVFLAREGGVLAGIEVAALAFEAVDKGVRFEAIARDGASFRAGDALARVHGRARSILAAERVSLNFLQRLSGTATLARRFVDAVAGTRARIYDTRKTTPGLRALEKYAVRAGGAENHRMSLEDQALVKDNHLAVLARRSGVAPDEVDLRAALAAIRARREGIFIEVEAATLPGVERALEASPDAILLDNMDVPALSRAVALVEDRCRARSLARPALEASGGVTLETVRAIAGTGVDRVSVGALTHSARALDIALEFQPG